MKNLFIIFAFLVGCSSQSIIEKEREFLKENQNISKSELLKYLGQPDDSMVVKNGIVFVWDNLNGKMTLMTAPPYTPLDSADWFGKRQIHILFDSNLIMKDYRYWDFTNPKDFEKIINQK
jgi:hypothetical protein